MPLSTMSVQLEEAIAGELKPKRDEVIALDKDAYDLKCVFSLLGQEIGGGVLGPCISTTPEEVNNLLSKIKENPVFRSRKKETFESRSKELTLGEQLVIDNVRCLHTSIKGYMEYFFNHPELVPGSEFKPRLSKKDLDSARKETFNVPNLLTALYGSHINHFDELKTEILGKHGVDIGERMRLPIYLELEGNVRPIDGKSTNPNRNYNREEQRKFNEIYFKLTSAQHNPTNEEIRARSKKELKGMREFLAHYLNSTGRYRVNAKTLPFEFQLGAPDESVSTWTDNLELMTLEADALFIYGKDRSICKALWYPTAIHEATHFEATRLSQPLPGSLKATTDSFMEFGPITIEEGRAFYMESEKTSWLEKNANKYNLSKDDLELIKLYPRAYIQSRALGILYTVSLARELTTGDGRKQFDGQRFAAAHIGNVSERPFHYADSGFHADEGLNDSTIYRINYPIGYRYVQNTLGLVKKILGEEVYEENKNIINQVMLTGQWSPGAHEQYMLRLGIPLIKESIKK